MSVTLLRGVIVLAALAVCLAGCASRAWRFVDDAPSPAAAPARPPLPPHRSVERVVLGVGGHELEFVGYRTCDPEKGEVRTQLVLESGISVLDVAVRGAQNRRISGSAFEAIPGFAETTMEDLRRIWGSRSVFGRLLQGMAAGRIAAEPVRTVTDGTRTLAAEPLSDGSWLAIEEDGFDRGDPLRVTLLTAALVPEARIDYRDFDAAGIPREIHLLDLRRDHALDVEVEEASVVAPPPDAR